MENISWIQLEPERCSTELQVLTPNPLHHVDLFLNIFKFALWMVREKIKENNAKSRVGAFECVKINILKDLRVVTTELIVSNSSKF